MVDIIRKWLLWIIVLLSIIGFVLLTGCKKEEPLWKLPPPGNETIDAVAMGEFYDNTVFFKLSTQAKYERDINTWHLAFESAADGFYIKLNNGRHVLAYNTGSTNFSITEYDVSVNAPWLCDVPSGNLDSTAIGNWKASGPSNSAVYIISMGYNNTDPDKNRKLQVLSVSDTNYVIKYARIDGSDIHEVSISKSVLSTFTYFDLGSGTTVIYEPSALNYDLVFTKYKHIFFEENEITPYMVNGALLNPVNTAAIRLDSLTFEQVNYDAVKDLNFSTATDAVGYNWKYYNLDLGKYTITKNLFAVKDREGAIWKLEFIDFYSDAGVKGYPKFRYQRL